jgi:carbon-monoxide dehydrogenase medium subunit
MKPAPFTYHDPQRLSDAISLLASLDNPKVLAGGQSLVPMLNMRFVQPDHIIDLNKLPGLSDIEIVGDVLRVGAMCRQRDLELSPIVRSHCPIIREALLLVGHRQTRNRGTLGGSLCHLDPAAELVAVAAALDAVVTVAGPSRTRNIPFADFPAGFMMPAIGMDEIVTEVRFPLWPIGCGYSFIEFARRHGDFAIVSAAALLYEDADGRVIRVSLTLGGVGVGPLRMKDAERMMVGHRASGALFREAAESGGSIDALEDAHVTSAYRRRLAKALSRRALEQAHARASDTSRAGRAS